MNFDYDVVIIGGAFSGAATALMLKRKRPEARVLIIEKGAAFVAMARRQDCLRHSTSLLWSGIKAILFGR